MSCFVVKIEGKSPTKTVDDIRKKNRYCEVSEGAMSNFQKKSCKIDYICN